MLPGTAQEDFLGRGGGAVRVFLLGGLHAACQADLQEVRCSLHLDVVCHQLELSVFPVVLRGARLQVGGEAVCEAEIQVGSLRMAGPELWAALPSADATGLSWQPALCWAGGSTGRGPRVTCCLSGAMIGILSPLGVVNTSFQCLPP